MGTNRKFTLLYMVWAVRWWLLALVVVLVVGMATDGQDVEPLFALEWDRSQGWHYPDDYSDYPDTVTMIACELDSAVVLMSPWWSGVQIAKLMLWDGDVPDWRNEGDGNPHPDEYWLIDVEAVAVLCDDFR